MKTLLSFLIMLVFAAPVMATEHDVNASPKTKQICKDVTAKKGKTVKQCKTIKIHKKHAGTVVPTKK